METLLTLFYLILFLFIVRFWKGFYLPGLPNYSAAAIYFIKFAAGVALAWVYKEYYTDRSTADMYKLYDDSKFMYEALSENPADFFKMLSGLDNNSPYFDQYYLKMNNWYRPYDVETGIYNDTRTLIRLNAFVRIFSLGVYSVHILVWCLLSMLGLSLVYRTFYRFLPEHSILLAGSIFLLPSVLCWGSGVLKEGVVLLLMGVFISALFRWTLVHFKWKYPLMIGVSIFGFYLLKVYILIALIPGSLAFVLSRLWGFKRVRSLFVGSLILFGLAGCFIQYLIPSINLLELIAFKQQAILRLAYYTDSGSALDINPLEPNIFSMLRNTPEALFNAAFRPSLIDATNMLQWMSAIENAFILLSFILSIGLYKPQQDSVKRAAAWFCLSFVFLLFLIMGLSTPILGTLVRFRMPALPFMFIAFMLFSDLPRLIALKNELLNNEK